MARKKAQRIPKGAKGLAIRKGGCRVVEGNIKICVSKTGVVSMTPSKRGPSKRKAGPKKNGRKPAAKRKKGAARKKTCISQSFNKRGKGKPTCGCLVRGKSGELAFQAMKKVNCGGASTYSLDSAKRMYETGNTSILPLRHGPARPARKSPGSAWSFLNKNR